MLELVELLVAVLLAILLAVADAADVAEEVRELENCAVGLDVGVEEQEGRPAPT